MTSRAGGFQDQASAPNAAASAEAKGGGRIAQSNPARPAALPDRQAAERRRSGNSLGIGAPLTAAFIGGFLVIENLAGADQLDEADAEAQPSDMTLFPDESGEGLEGAASEPEIETGTGAAAASNAVNADNPAAAPNENAGLQAGEGADTPASGAIPPIAAASALEVTGEGGGSSIEANVSILDIDISDGSPDDAIDPIVEEDILRRNQQNGTRDDDVLIGGDGDDAISGGSGDDIIHGGAGRDLLNGNEGDDQLFGEAGDDDLKGGAGNDILDGGTGNDDLLGGSGDDVLIVNNRHDVALDYDRPANSGEDLLIVQQGYADDTLESGIDSSAFFFSSENWGDELPRSVASHTQQVAVGIEHITLEGTANHDIVADSGDNRLTGNLGDNQIFAGSGDDRVIGGGGGDSLFGGDGNDELFGGVGDDIIEGGLGEDMLYGEAGDDLFLLGLADSAVDTVFDHEGANRLKIEGVTDQTVKTSLLDDDLYVTVDEAPVAKVEGYVGHEDAIAGIDFGQGLRSVDSLMDNDQDIAAALEAAEARAQEAAANDPRTWHAHLTEPTIAGDPRTDQRLVGTEEDDWLSGFDRKDVLFGLDGDDILAGGDGVDDLRGGAGNDRYLFEKGENGIDKIKDTEGRNLAELRGFDRAEIEGAMLGDDLAVLADGKLLFTVDDFAAHQDSFQGVQAGNKFIPTEDLLA